MGEDNKEKWKVLLGTDLKLKIWKGGASGGRNSSLGDVHGEGMKVGNMDF